MHVTGESMSYIHVLDNKRNVPITYPACMFDELFTRGNCSVTRVPNCQNWVMDSPTRGDIYACVSSCSVYSTAEVTHPDSLFFFSVSRLVGEAVSQRYDAGSSGVGEFIHGPYMRLFLRCSSSSSVYI
jgi:hypothetical protein